MLMSNSQYKFTQHLEDGYMENKSEKTNKSQLSGIIVKDALDSYHAIVPSRSGVNSD